MTTENDTDDGDEFEQVIELTPEIIAKGPSWGRGGE